MDRDYVGNDYTEAVQSGEDREGTAASASNRIVGEKGERRRRVLSAGTLAGDRVRNSAGEDLGKIEELMIDIESGRIAYAVLSFGGFLGMGNKLFAVPWHALHVNEADHEFLLNVDRNTLENAPGFDKDNWPDMADPDWGNQIHSHYGYKPYWSADRADDWDARGNSEWESSNRTEYDRDRTLSGGGNY